MEFEQLSEFGPLSAGPLDDLRDEFWDGPVDALPLEPSFMGQDLFMDLYVDEPVMGLLSPGADGQWTAASNDTLLGAFPTQAKAEAAITKKKKKKKRPRGTGGIRERGKKFEARMGRDWVGSFDTKAEAEDALRAKRQKKATVGQTVLYPSQEASAIIDSTPPEEVLYPSQEASAIMGPPEEVLYPSKEASAIMGTTTCA